MITDSEILSALAGKSILVVDDEKFSRSIISRLLHPLTIVEASDGALGLHQFLSDPTIAMIVCDFNMPVMDGLKLLKAVRSGLEGARHGVPFLMLTGTSDSALVSLALNLDVDGFIVKPVSQSVLEGRVKHVLTCPHEIKPANHYATMAVDEVSKRLLGGGFAPCLPAEPEKAKPAEPPASPVGRRLALEVVQPQSVLASDVRAPSGELLVAAGVPLSHRLIRRLRELAPMGIAPSHVWITA